VSSWYARTESSFIEKCSCQELVSSSILPTLDSIFSSVEGECTDIGLAGFGEVQEAVLVEIAHQVGVVVLGVDGGVGQLRLAGPFYHLHRLVEAAQAALELADRTEGALERLVHLADQVPNEVVVVFVDAEPCSLEELEYLASTLDVQDPGVRQSEHILI
jgi:hypothetical protein